MNIPIFTFTGFSGTGKTTYIEKLIPCLKARGLRVAVIKHDAHKFEIDREGKDSWRFSNAGAEIVAVLSKEKFALVEQRPVSLDEVLSHIHDVDIVLTEGWKTGPWPKIGIFRAGSGRELAVSPEELMAVVTDTPLEVDAPQFPLDDPEPMADFLAGKCYEFLPINA